MSKKGEKAKIICELTCAEQLLKSRETTDADVEHLNCADVFVRQ